MTAAAEISAMVKAHEQRVELKQYDVQPRNLSPMFAGENANFAMGTITTAGSTQPVTSYSGTQLLNLSSNR